jgi:chromosome segregation ATPase
MSVSIEKNHEQYLEQIETAVAETTMDILEKHSGNLRAMAKLVAEKQVEINRLKEFYNDDRKTIRSLRVKLNEAVADAELYKKANIHEHTSCYDGRMMLVKTLWGDSGKEYEDRIDLCFPKINEKIEELIDEIECIHSTLESTEGHYECEVKELNEQYTKAVQDINQRDLERTSLLKENKELKEQLEDDTRQVHTLFTENEELKEEIKKLKRGDKRKLKKKVEELEKEIEGLNEHTSDYDTEVEMRSLAEKQLEELQNEHQGICSKYHADFCELEEKREEVIRLNKFKEASISQVNSHLEQIVELKKELEKLKSV